MFIRTLDPPALFVQFSEDFANDLGHLVGGKRVATFGFGYLFGECLNGVDTADQHVS